MQRRIGKALVVGAGIGGIRASLDLAAHGYHVTLIDRSPYMGGVLSLLDHQFPSNHCGMCRMLPTVERDVSRQVCLRKGLFHNQIDVRLSTELIELKGEAGLFEATLRSKTVMIDPKRCLGCGDCNDVCPVCVPDEFYAGLGRRKAVFRPVPHAIPSPFIIDTENCTRCGQCLDVCPTDAIDISSGLRRDFSILVVDDEFIVRHSLKEWMDMEGFDVDVAASGSEALKMIEEKAYHLMLLDIKMPDMDGVEVLKHGLERQPELTVIMMTAYATVETAVNAMKIGAMDYLVKPFEMTTLMPMIERVYGDRSAAEGDTLNISAVVLAGGVEYFDPSGSAEYYGYGRHPGVVTHLEFERLLNPMGLNNGNLIRPQDGKPVRRIAWLQCIGSRELEKDYCSSICCMSALKEAMLARRVGGSDLETCIYYMDLRTFGKTYNRYRENALSSGVRIERARVHSVRPDPKSNDLVIEYLSSDGTPICRNYDLIVLSVGQCLSPSMIKMAEMLELKVRENGFIEVGGFAPVETSRMGILVAGSAAGLKDISETIIHSSAAALAASRIIHSHGGSLGVAAETSNALPLRDVSLETVSALIVVCTCNNRILGAREEKREFERQIKQDPEVGQVLFVEQMCSSSGREALIQNSRRFEPNRLVVGGCLSYVYARGHEGLANEIGLPPQLIEVVDIHNSWPVNNSKGQATDISTVLFPIKTGLAKMKRTEPRTIIGVPIIQRALVIGGGVAGLTAALAVADHGYEVDLLERSATIGGHLTWLADSLDENNPKALLGELKERISKHPLISVHLNSKVIHADGVAGHFNAEIQDSEQKTSHIVSGVIILAMGGEEALTNEYSYNESERIITQKQFEEKMIQKELDLHANQAVAMIQCVGSREEPRNYCSRVCCPASLKMAIRLKKETPDLQVYIFYRDMMTPGFLETLYTEARRLGVVFILYNENNKPLVKPMESYITITTFDPILQQPVTIEADWLVLATGIVPNIANDLVKSLDFTLDSDGFFNEADSKWRPVNSLKEGIFACGLFHSPRDIAGSVATAEAAAQGALNILRNEQYIASRQTARIRHSLCSLCGRCIEACPFGARVLDADIGRIVLHEIMCQGCGACAAACPNSASTLTGYTDQQMLTGIDAALAHVWT